MVILKYKLPREKSKITTVGVDLRRIFSKNLVPTAAVLLLEDPGLSFE